MKETTEQEIGRIKADTATAERLRQERAAKVAAIKERNAAQAKALLARLELIKTHATPVVRATRAISREAYSVGKTLGDVGLRTAYYGFKGAAHIGRIVAQGDKFSLGVPKTNDSTWVSLETAFGYSPFSRDQGITAVMIARRVDKERARTYLNRLLADGNVVAGGS